MPIYNGNNKYNPAGIAKVYIGNNLVFQNNARWKRYYVSGNFETYLVTHNSHIYSIGAAGTQISNLPKFPKRSLDVPSFDFSGGAYRTIPDNGSSGGWQYWASNSDSIKTGSASYDPSYYAIITGYRFATFFVYFDCDIYGIRKIDNSHVRGDYIDTVEASAGTYPDNGEQDGYWYVKVGEVQFESDVALNKGNLIPLVGWSTSDFIEVPEGCTNITIETGMAQSGHDCLCEYGANQEYLSYWGAGENPRTFSFDYPNAIKFMRVTFLTSAIDNCYVYDNTHGRYIYKGANV